MRRALAVLLCFLLGTPSAVFSYDDYSSHNNNNNRSGSSLDLFQANWSSHNNWANNFNNSTPFIRSVVQVPSYNFDSLFSSSFNSHNSFNFSSNNPNTSFNSSSFNTGSRLDLNSNSYSFSGNTFTAQPVVSNFNFNQNHSSFNSQNTPSASLGGFSSFQTPRQESYSSQSIRGPELTYSAGLSRSPNTDFNSYTLPSRSSSLNVFNTAMASPMKLFTAAPAAVLAVQNAFSNLFSIPKIEGLGFSALTPAAPVKAQPLAAMEAGRGQKTLFDSVAAAFKAVPAFIVSVGSKIKDAAIAVWNRVVLGHRTEESFKMPDGSALSGKITVNRKNEIVSVAPGTVRTVGREETTEGGKTLFLPAKNPVSINGEDCLQGNFTYDGEKFNLVGVGIMATKRAGPTLEGGETLKLYVNGDGKGNNTPLGYGALSKRDTFTEKTTGLSFRNENGFWNFDKNQSATLKLDGNKVPLTIDEGSRLAAPVAMPVTGQQTALTLVTGVLPNPETSGYQLNGVAVVKEGGEFRAAVPGTRPSQYMRGQLDAWRKETAFIVRLPGFMTNTETVATVHQEGDEYVFTGGMAAFSLITEPNLKTADDGVQTVDGQKTAYTEAVLSEMSKLTVTGPTEFPAYGTTVFAGKAAFRSEGKMELASGTLYANQDQGVRLVVRVGGREQSIPVKSLDLESGRFTAVIPDIQQGAGEYVRMDGKEIEGRIDFNNGQAFLVDTAFKSPLLGPSQFAGVNRPDEYTGAGWVTVRGNTISVRQDRSGVGLDKWRAPDSRSTLAAPATEGYKTLVKIFSDGTNPAWARGSAFVLAVGMAPVMVAEEGLNFSLEAKDAWRDMSHQGTLAYLDLKAGQKMDAGLDALVGVYYTSEFVLRAIPIAEVVGPLSRAIAAEVGSLTQAARQMAGKISFEVPTLRQIAAGESGSILIPERLGSTPIATRALRQAIPPQQGEVVLGKYPQYVEMAESIGAKKFSVPKDVWGKMSEAEKWTANRKFLDRAISRGDSIRLASPVEKAPGSFFEKELKYLETKGYKLSVDGKSLVRE